MASDLLLSIRSLNGHAAGRLIMTDSACSIELRVGDCYGRAFLTKLELAALERHPDLLAAHFHQAYYWLTRELERATRSPTPG